MQAQASEARRKLLAQGRAAGPPAGPHEKSNMPHCVGAPAARTRASRRRADPDVASSRCSQGAKLSARWCGSLSWAAVKERAHCRQRHSPISLSELDTRARYPTECNFLISASRPAAPRYRRSGGAYFRRPASGPWDARGAQLRASALRSAESRCRGRAARGGDCQHDVMASGRGGKAHPAAPAQSARAAP